MFFVILVEYLPSARGNILALYKNYTYYRIRRGATNGMVRWCCSTNKNCKGFIRMANNIVVRQNNNHNHPPPNLIKVEGQYIRI